MENLPSGVMAALLPSPYPSSGGRETRGVSFMPGTKKNGSMRSSSLWLGFDYP
jgi:hypothetical protein